MDIIVSQTGIDVAKDELVVSIDKGKAYAVANDLSHCLSLASQLPPGGVVHLEASGGYERLVCRTLRGAGFKVVVHNPLKAKRLAQAQGVKAKTDAVDAVGLSRSGNLLPEGSVKAESRENLADHSRALDALRVDCAQYKKRLRMPGLDALAAELYRGAILALEALIAGYEKSFQKRILASDYAEDYKLLQSVPAIGRVTARILLCEFPEDLKERSAGEIASYAGLAPIDNQSGKRTGKASLGRGNSRLKAAFYMPAVCALKTQPWATELYAKLRAKGKAHQTAMVAVMRRLLVRAVAVLKRGSTWEVKPTAT